MKKRSMRMLAKILTLMIILNFIIISQPIHAVTQDSQVASGQVEQENEKTAKKYYVSTKGTKKGNGSMGNPFPTLEAARDQIRKDGVPKGGITVYVRSGTYEMTKSFQLNAQDAGSKNDPVIYSAYPGEQVSLVGSKQLDSSKLKKVTDAGALARIPKTAQSKVYVYSLKENGIDAGSIQRLGFGSERKLTIPEISVNGVMQSVARYPNKGFTAPTAVVKGGVGDNEPISADKPVLAYTDSRYDKWANETDSWLSGYFRFDWADDMLRVAVDKDANTLTLEGQSSFGTSNDPNRIKMYGYNLLCELDSAGEYYIDRKDGKNLLYIYLDDKPVDAKIVVSTLKEPIVQMEGTSYVKLKNMLLGQNLAQGITMKDCTNCVIEGCEIYRTAMCGIEVGLDYYNSDLRGGTDNVIRNCTIHETGMGGVQLSGGVYDTLTPCNNVVEGCNIYDFSRIIRTYTPAVNMNGVGAIVRNNEIHDAPHFALQFRGNDMLIEKNNIYNVLQETGDAGAIYSGKSWVWRGNVIRYNYIHDIPNVSSTSFAIYLDDAMSGVEVYGNIIANIEDRAYLFGGGRDHKIHDNTYVNIGKGVYSFDNRTLNTHRQNNTDLAAGFYSRPVTSTIWTQKYPDLAASYGRVDININDQTPVSFLNSLTLNPMIPANNSIQNETLVNADFGSIVKMVRKYGDIDMNPSSYIASKDVLDKSSKEFTDILLDKASDDAQINNAKKTFVNSLSIRELDTIQQGTPIMDGIYDEMYKNSLKIELSKDYWLTDKPELGDNTGWCSFLWDADYLYVYAAVSDKEVITNGYKYTSTDPNPWLNDALEVFMDEYKVSVDAYGIRCFTHQNQFTDEYLAKMPKASALTKDGKIIKYTKEFRPEELAQGYKSADANGYIVEMAVPLATILEKTPKAGDAVSLKIQNNDLYTYDQSNNPQMRCTNTNTKMVALSDSRQK